MTRPRRLKLVPVVEGYGEERAVPVLLRSFFSKRGLYHIEVPEFAVNAKGCGTLKAAYDPGRKRGIEYFVTSARRSGADAIAVVLDADKECHQRATARRPGLGVELLKRAEAHADGRPIWVFVADRAYEAWFVGTAASLVEARAFVKAPPAGATLDRAGYKGLMRDLLGRPYEESTDMAALSRHLPLDDHADWPPSYRRLLRKLEELAARWAGESTGAAE